MYPFQAQASGSVCTVQRITHFATISLDSHCLPFCFTMLVVFITFAVAYMYFISKIGKVQPVNTCGYLRHQTGDRAICKYMATPYIHS